MRQDIFGLRYTTHESSTSPLFVDLIGDWIKGDDVLNLTSLISFPEDDVLLERKIYQIVRHQYKDIGGIQEEDIPFQEVEEPTISCLEKRVRDYASSRNFSYIPEMVSIYLNCVFIYSVNPAYMAKRILCSYRDTYYGIYLQTNPPPKRYPYLEFLNGRIYINPYKLSEFVLRGLDINSILYEARSSYSPRHLEIFMRHYRKDLLDIVYFFPLIKHGIPTFSMERMKDTYLGIYDSYRSFISYLSNEEGTLFKIDYQTNKTRLKTVYHLCRNARVYTFLQKAIMRQWCLSRDKIISIEGLRSLSKFETMFSEIRNLLLKKIGSYHGDILSQLPYAMTSKSIFRAFSKKIRKNLDENRIKLIL